MDQGSSSKTLGSTPSNLNAEEPDWSPSVDATSSHELVECEDVAASFFVKAHPIQEPTPNSTLDSTLSKNYRRNVRTTRRGGDCAEKPTCEKSGIGSTAAVQRV